MCRRDKPSDGTGGWTQTWGTVAHDLPCRIDSEVLWRRDGTPLAVEYTSYPILDAGEVLACDWLVLPKDCGRPDFLSDFELVEQVETAVPSHHTYAYDLYRRRPSIPISVESDSTDAEPFHRDP